MTIRDFMNYLIYIEHAAENLQFYIWYLDYSQRFKDAATSDLALSPEWTRTMEDEAISKIRKFNVDKMRANPQAAEIFKGTDFERNNIEPLHRPHESTNPFSTPPRTPVSVGDHESFLNSSTIAPSTKASSYKSQAAEAFESVGVKQPCKLW